VKSLINPKRTCRMILAYIYVIILHLYKLSPAERCNSMSLAPRWSSSSH
jgi:hypothetical protein